MNELRIGIAGFGVVGKQRYKSILKIPDTKIVAVSDKIFLEDHPSQNGYLCLNDYKKIYSQNLDVLFVCLTNDVSADAVIAGLENGLHVFCEKPPGKNLADVNRVIECKKKYLDQKLMYGFNHRYHHSVQEALRIIRSGELGNILNLHGLYGKSKLITFNQSDWRTKKSIAGGGVLLDQGIHMVDLMRLFAGEFVDIHSFVSNNYWSYDVEDNAYALMKTQDGIVGILHSSATQWRHRFHLDINLEKGSLILAGILSGSKSYGAETLTIVRANPDTDHGDPQEQMMRYNHDPSWDEEVKTFFYAIRHDQPIEHGTVTDAYHTMNLVDRIYQADKNWQVS
ncbi:MAG: hypothetical protein ACD_46C00181G0029 [uncultured bacterium]|nr:MAG: hypothetical protein ACD_46C00181G0029 [uncultured bacterium]